VCTSRSFLQNLSTYGRPIFSRIFKHELKSKGSPSLLLPALATPDLALTIPTPAPATPDIAFGPSPFAPVTPAPCTSNCRTCYATSAVGVETSHSVVSTPCLALATPPLGLVTPRQVVATPSLALATPPLGLATPRQVVAIPCLALATPPLGLTAACQVVATPCFAVATSALKIAASSDRMRSSNWKSPCKTSHFRVFRVEKRIRPPRPGTRNLKVPYRGLAPAFLVTNSRVRHKARIPQLPDSMRALARWRTLKWQKRQNLTNKKCVR
jgi:hypothetical protein